MNYEITRHTTGILIVHLSNTEAEKITESDCNTSLIYEIGKKYFGEANFGKLGNTKIVYVVYCPYDKEIHVSIKGKFKVCVETESSSEAEKIASKKWDDADFGELKDVDYNKTVICYTLEY